MKDNLHNEIRWILQEKYNGQMTALAKKDVARLKAGEPVDFLIGFVEFLGCKIDLSKRPLIPRLETEFWVEKAIDEMKAHSTRFTRSGQNLRILDMFSGSGCIGVAVLKGVENSLCDFADSEDNCLKQIKVNCKINGIKKNRVGIIESDIFENVEGKYDYIFANPPYIPVKNQHKVQKSALQYEPHAAMFGGNDGLTYINIFLADAKNHLNAGGKIFMEFDSPQKKKIEAMLKKYGYRNFEFKKDQFHRWRYVVAN